MWGDNLELCFFFHLTEWGNRDVSSVTDSFKCSNICCRAGNWLAGSACSEWLVVRMDWSWAFASLENNSELSIQEQAGELILVCGWGQQLWLHQGPIRGCVSPARLTPAGVYVSAPLQETGGDRGEKRVEGSVAVFLTGNTLENTVVLSLGREKSL